MKRMKVDLKDIRDEDDFYNKNHRATEDDFYKKSNKNLNNKKSNKNRHSQHRDEDDKEFL
jgi:hypothetical protein